MFSKSDSAWVGFFFGKEKNLKKPNTLEYAQVLVVTCRKLNSDKCLLRPPPPPIMVLLVKETRVKGMDLKVAWSD